MTKQTKETLEMIAKEPIKPVEVKWIITERPAEPRSIWHIHMTWLILCIVSGAMGFYFGYGPNWTHMVGQ